jgi:hypothetical protein
MTNTVNIGALLGIIFIVFVFGAIIPFVFIGTGVLAVGAGVLRGRRRLSSGRRAREHMKA